MNVMVAIGTRPEAIKMAPVIRELRARSGIDTFVCVTAQHRQMLDQVLDLFDIRVDVDFDLMRESQTLNGLTARIFDVANGLLKQEKPDLVLVHGDTTTAMAMSLACFHLGIASGHVEAGLRTYDFERPFRDQIRTRTRRKTTCSDHRTPARKLRRRFRAHMRSNSFFGLGA